MAPNSLKTQHSFRRKFVRQFAIIVLIIIQITLLFPLTIFILLPVSLVLRLFAKLMARVLRPDLSEIFGGQGLAFAVESIHTRPKTNILLHMFFNNGPILIEQFRSQFEQHVFKHTNASGFRLYEKLTQTWTSFMGFIFWKQDEDFKLNNHIRLYDYMEPELALPAKCHEDDLKRITGELLTRPWVRGQSPWEILVIQNCHHTTEKHEKETGSVAILRIHHALADGYSMLTMLLRFADNLSVKRVTPNFPKMSLFQKLTHSVVVLLKLPYDYAEYIVDFADGPNCGHFLWKKLSGKCHVFFSGDIPVEKIKTIRKIYGVGYNTAVFSHGDRGYRRDLKNE